MWTLHPSWIYILRWSLKRCVKWTWTGSSAFPTNESAWSVMVMGSQSLMWSSRLRARDHYTSSALIGGKGGGASPSSQLHTMLAGPTEGVCECMKMDVKPTWIPSYMASNGSCFKVTWTIFQNHLLEIQDRLPRVVMVHYKHTCPGQLTRVTRNLVPCPWN